MNNKKLTSSLHTHVRSLYDADINPNALCERIIELDGKGCAITDHGVLSSIEDYRAAFAAYNLKMIPGVELYVDGGILGRLHLVLLAVNDNGYHEISKIVTKSNLNLSGDFPVTTEDMLKEFVVQGDIIALSGCMQGVIAAIFLQNEKVKGKINKLVNKQSKFINPKSTEYTNAVNAVENAESAVKDAMQKRDYVKQVAEQSFAKREKAVTKLEKEGDITAAKEREILERDKCSAQKAKEELPSVKETLEKAKKALSSAKRTLKTLSDSVDKFMKYQSEIDELSKELKDERILYAMAKNEMQKYIELFGKENFYAEVQYHGIPEEAICFPKVITLAKEMGIPLVATNDVHLLRNTEDERLRRQILRSLRFGSSFEEEGVGDSELYLKDNEELKEALIQIISEEDADEAIANIDVVFNRCNVNFEIEKHYPKFSVTEDVETIFDREVAKGVKWRFPEGMDEEHKKRLEYEVGIIKQMGYVDYHLVVKDFLEYGRLLGFVPDSKIADAPLTIPELQDYIKANGWTNGGLTIGPGRGSAVGSIVCYCLGITNLDPIKYGLLFERFLNPERVSMPDIDSDIYSTGRSKVIEYVRNKYGQDSVCGIMTMTMQGPKGSIDIAAKYYGLKKTGTPFTTLGRTIAKDVPSDPGTSFATIVDGVTVYDSLLKKYADNPEAKDILHWAKIIEGVFTSYSAHAAGVVISDGSDVANYLPLRMNTGLGMMTTQCTKDQVEDNGLLKFDFLGLKTLDIITQTIRMVEKNRGFIIDPLKIDLNDGAVYKEIFASGNTNSVFQFESSGMKKMLKGFSPECFEDLIILVSMFRPGPLQYLNDVIDVKNGTKPMTFLCPQLEPILGSTYGAIVYQEQVMQICQSLAGFTLGHADQVRRFMSKKKAVKLAHEKEAFIEGCAKNGIAKDVAETLFEQMMDFASYAFNKSHAAAYAYNAYITGWLKKYYPTEFFTAALNWTTSAKLAGLMYEAKVFGVDVKAPDINLSGKDFECDIEIVRFGLSSVAGVKNNADEILEERKKGAFASLSDFCLRCNANIRVLTNLIDAGAFDSFSKNRGAMKSVAQILNDKAGDIRKKQSFIASAEFVLPKVETLTSEEAIKTYQEGNGYKTEVKKPSTAANLEKKIATAKTALANLQKEVELIREPKVVEDKIARMEREKELLGIYVTEHPMDFYPTNSEMGIPAIDTANSETEVIYGIISNLTAKNRKKDGKTMAFFTLEDKSGSIDVACFTKEYAEYGERLKDGAVITIKGTCTEETYEDGENIRTELKFMAKSIGTVNQKRCSFVMSVPSYAAFYLDAEEEFVSRYADDEDGYSLLIHDRALNEMREFNHKVSDKIRTFPNVEEIYI